MRIEDAINALTRLAAQHGPSVEVFFDCPTCGTSYQPSFIGLEVKHIVNVKAATTGPEVPK